jgi:hypothetical protein
MIEVYDPAHPARSAMPMPMDMKMDPNMKMEGGR